QAHRLVLTDEPGRQLMVEVPTGVSHLDVEPGDLAAGLGPVRRALALARQRALPPPKRRLPGAQPAWVVDLLPGRQRREAGQPEVHPDRRLDDRQRLGGGLADERGGVAPPTAEGDREPGRAGGGARG